MSKQLQNQTLKGRVAIVTGSSRGIGHAIATTLAKEGAKVVVTGTEEERTRLAAEEIAQSYEAEVEYFAGDLSIEENVDALVEKTIKRWDKIDILVNNAGGGVILPFLSHTKETLETTINRNLWTCIWPCYKVLPI